MESNIHFKLEWDDITRKKRDCSQMKDLLQELAQMDGEALTSRSMKLSRVEGQEERKGKHQSVGIDESHWSMQPPRPSSKGFMQTEMFSLPSSKVWDVSRQALMSGVHGKQAQPSYVGSHAEKASGISRDNSSLPLQMSFPPPDEGSRTGLKGSKMASLVNNGSTTPPDKVISQTAGISDSPCYSNTRYQSLVTTSRQLTVFYGGQAHVFDDVPFDKAEAIMALAGSNGSSWSTTYSPQLSKSLAASTREASLSVVEREKEKTLRRDGAIKGFSSLALSSSDMQPIPINALRPGLSNRVGSFNLSESNINYVPQLPEARVVTDKRASAMVHSSANIDESCRGGSGG